MPTKTKPKRGPGRPKKGEIVVEHRGRPTIMTPEKIALLEEAFLLGCSDLEACFAAGVSKTCLYNYQNDNPDFVERKNALKENPVYVARKSVLRDMQENGRLAFDYLSKRKRDEFADKQEVETKLTVSLPEEVRDKLSEIYGPKTGA